MIYLDNAATTYPKPTSVYEKMDEVNRLLAFNAGRGSYKVAREATAIIDDTRKKLIEIVNGIGKEKAVMTSSATEALNIILKGIPFKSGDVVYISPFEHNAVARVLETIRKNIGVEVKLLPLDEDLRIDIEKTRYLFIKDKPKCVCCTHVSNVTGYILPVKDIFEIAKDNATITVLDAAQSFGLLSIDTNKIKSDFIVFAGHKTLYGPFGAAGFIDVNNVSLDVQFAGGTGSNSLNLNMPEQSPDKYEFGSKNIVAIAGLNQALYELDMDKTYKHEKELSLYLINKLKDINGVVVYAPEQYETEHIGVVSFNIDGYIAEDVGSILDEEFDIAVRTGNHCAPYVHEVLQDNKYNGTVRVGIGCFTTEDDIDQLIDAIIDIKG